MKPATLLIIGAGSRGTGYAGYAKDYPDRAKVVGVAEPRDPHRNNLVEAHGIPPENVFTDWKQAAQHDRFADAVLICTLDQMHAEPAIAFANKGYHILLEKPMATTEEDCRRIVDAVRKNRVLFTVGHVMRYTSYTRKLKALVDEGAIGELVNIQHLEPVGFWHQAHSFVRGNWGNESQTTFMLMSKSCHDIDWLIHITNARCVKISSFGSLKHFKKECQPAGAASRCLDCDIEPRCPYSAKRIYLGRVAKGQTEWPVDILTPNPTMESVTEALRTGPYGRCVYECDNDVVDNQIVVMEFESGRTASFMMSAFCFAGHRQTRLFGTHGEILGDGSILEVRDFVTGKTTKIDTEAADATIVGGHGGGDFGLIHGFVEALLSGDPSTILTGPTETLESHLAVFAAEKARRSGSVVAL